MKWFEDKAGRDGCEKPQQTKKTEKKKDKLQNLQKIQRDMIKKTDNNLHKAPKMFKLNDGASSSILPLFKIQLTAAFATN